MLLLVFSLAACAAPAPTPAPAPAPTPAPAPEVIRWRMYQNSGSLAVSELDKRTWRWPANYLELGEKFNQVSDGRLQVQVMTPAELGFKGTEILRAMNDNLVEVAEVGWGYHAKEVPWLGIIELPFLIRESYVEHRIVLDVFRPYLEEMANTYDFTIYQLTRQHSLPCLAFYTKIPINSVDDLKGLKIRIYDPYQEGFLAEAGATPVFMPFSEVPAALAQGVIDGAFTSVGLGTMMGVYESGIRYETGTYPGLAMGGIAVNNKALNSLPSDLQQVVVDVMKWFNDNNIAHTYNPVFAWEMMKADEDAGLTITPGTPEFNATLEEMARRSSWAKYEEDAGALGTEIIDKSLAALGRPR